MKIIFLLLIALATMSSLAAQMPIGKILGVVIETGNGETLAGATVYLQEIDKGTITNQKGEFAFAGLKSGTYTAKVSLLGYQTDTKKIVLNNEETIHIAISLESEAKSIDEVVITATRTPKKISQSPIVTQVVTAKQIESRAITDIKNLLAQEIPGLLFNEVGFGTSINLQGLGGKHILFLIDGERMAGETGDNIDYNRLNLNDVERIEIVQGASSSLYGSQAMGGVINVITKRQNRNMYASIDTKWAPLYERNFRNVSDDDFQKTFKKNADMPNINLNAIIGGNWGKWSAKSDIAIKSSDAYQLFNTDSISKYFSQHHLTINQPLDRNPINVSGMSSLTVTQTIGFKPTKNLSLSAKGSYYQMNKYDLSADNKYQNNTDISALLNSKYTISKVSDIGLSFYIDRYNKYNRFELLKNKKEHIYTHQIVQSRLLYSLHAISSHQINAGAEYTNENLYTDKFVSGTYESRIENSVSGFVQDDWKLSSKISIIGGLRVDFGNTYGVNISPKLAAIYKTFPFTFRLNYANGYRSPSLKELYMNWDHLGMFMIYGNKNLKPEKNRYLSLSSEYASKYFYVLANVYANFFTQKIEGIWTKNQTELHYQNVNSTILAGANVNMRFNPLRNLCLYTSLNYLIPRYKQGIRLTTQSPLSGNARTEYHITINKHKITLNLSGSIFGENKYSVLDKIKVNGVETEAYYTAKVPAYSLWYLAASYQMPKYARITLGVDNIFDYKARIINFNTYTGTGRSVFIALNIAV